MEGKVYKNNKEMIYFSIHIIFFVLTEMFFFGFLSEIINKFFHWNLEPLLLWILKILFFQ